jgi:hypothetical protein
MIRWMIFFLLMAAGACRPRELFLSKDEKENLAEIIRETLNDYHRDVKERGLTAEFKYLDSSDDFFWVPPGYTTAISYDSVANLLKQVAPLLKSVHNSWDTLTIIPLSTGLAMYTGRLHSITTNASGKRFESVLIETGVLIKRKDGWKLLSGQTSIIEK